MINLDTGRKLVITGAAGWLGTQTLEMLLAEYSSETLLSSVVCFGSRARLHSLSDGTQIPIYDFSDENEIDSHNIDGILHLSFLTRDKTLTMAPAEYVYQNVQITSRAVQLIEKIRPRWIATVSSGAVFSEPQGPLENNLDKNPYGFTKRIEETLLRDVAHSIGSHLAIGRLWGAMGAHMPVNRAYAVSDFILQALENGQINITSDALVWRRYCDAKQFMEVLISSADQFEYTEFDSGGRLTEMGELANYISEFCPIPNGISRPELTGEDNVYFPDDSEYEKLRTALVIPETDWKTLIKNTVSSHLKQLQSK